MARKLAPDKWLFAATTGLALFGVVMVYSASAVMAQKQNGNQFYYVLKQGVWVAIGIPDSALTSCCCIEDRALRSILPFGVSGQLSRKRKKAGIM